MYMIKRKGQLPSASALLLSAAVEGAASVLPSGDAEAGSLGARPGVGTSAGVGGGAVGAGPGRPARGAAGAPVAAPRGYIYGAPGTPTNRGGPVNRAGRR